MTENSSFISPKHESLLKKSAIPADKAREWGIKSVSSDADFASTDLGDPHNLNKGYTGVLYPLRRLDGIETFQLRLDNPPLDENGKPKHKYLQAAGLGSIINVPQSMADRVESATRLVFVEGTKQTIAASLAMADRPDTLVVGIQGCRNWSSEGVPVQDLASVMTGREEIYIGLDADWRTNPNVWDAANELYELAGTYSGDAKVGLITISGGKTTGMDDILGTAQESERPRMIENLIKKSLGKPVRRPAAKKTVALTHTAADAKVDLERGRITRLVSVAGEAREETILSVGARIVSAEAHIDEDTGETSNQMLTLEVTLPVNESDDFDDADEMDAPASPSSRKTVRHKVRVSSRELANVGEWLDRLPGGIGVSIARKHKPDDDVANAIRSVSIDFDSTTVISHTGWALDRESNEWRWLEGAGAIGMFDKSLSLRGEPASRDFQAINLPDISGLSAPKVAAYARKFIMARDLIKKGREFSWDVAVASWALAFVGVVPKAAVCYFGPPSSGKSTIAQALASSLSPTWAPGSGTAMATFNARPAGMDLLPNGLSNCFLHVDDLRPEADEQNMKLTLRAFDALLRRAHGSGGAVRGEINRSKDSLGVRKVDSSSPMMIITGEQIPSGDGFAASALDRALFISVQPKSHFLSANELHQFESQAQSGDYTYATSSFLSWVAAQINDTKDMPDEIAKNPERYFEFWRSRIEEMRQNLSSASDGENGIFPKDMKVSSRAQLLAASLLLGYNTALTWAFEIEAINESEYVALSDAFKEGLVRQVKEHTREVMGGNASEGDIALAQLRNAVSSGSVVLGDDTDSHKPIVGKFWSSGNEDYVAINHNSAASAIRFVGGGSTLSRALAEFAIPDSTGRRSRAIAIGGTRVQCTVIARKVWDGDQDDEAEASDVNSHNYAS